MSKWKNKNGKTVRRNTLAEQFCSQPIGLKESPAYRILSLAARRILDRIEIELRKHAGNGNGKLIVTKLQFIEYGLHQDAIAPALRELNALGIITVTAHGRGGNAEHRQPNKFLLNYQCGAIDAHELITNSWKRFKTLEEAEQVAAIARKAKDPKKVAYGRRNNRRRNISRPWKPCLAPDMETMPETRKFPDMETMPTRPGMKTMPTSEISGGGGEEAVDIKEGAATPADAPIGHNAGPPLQPEITGLKAWTTPTLIELEWNDYWQRYYCEVVEATARTA
jgi:hypothetical protein